MRAEAGYDNFGYAFLDFPTALRVNETQSPITPNVMNAAVLLAVSILLQGAAVVAAIRLITITGKRTAWILISLAIGLMAVRRCLTLYRHLSDDTSLTADPAAEAVAVVISALMFVGLVMIGPLFRSIRDKERAETDAMARFKHLAETTREGVVIHENGVVCDCNSAFARDFGYTREEVIGLSVSRFVAPDSRELVMSHLRAGFEEPYEHHAIRKDGTIIVVEARGRNTVIDGRTVRVTTIRDVTDRKRIEEALRDRERAMATLLANLPGVAYRCKNDRPWTMEFVSDGCRALTGYDVDEIVGNRVTSFGDMQHPDDREKIWSEVQKALAARKPFQLNYRITTKDGTEKWVWEQGVGVYSSAGDLIAIEGFITDISVRVSTEQALRAARDLLEERVKLRTADLEATNARLEREIQERTRIAQALKKSEEKFRLLSTSAPIGIFLTDASGQTIYTNPRLLEIAGLSEQEAMGWGWLNCIHPEDREDIAKAARNAAETGQDFDQEFRILRRDGQVRWVHAQNAPITDDAGASAGKVGSVEDITERKLAEAALRQREAQHEMILRSVPMALYTAELDNCLTTAWISDQIVAISGFSAQSFTDTPSFWIDRIHPEDRAPTLASFEKVFKGESASMEYRWLAADGIYRWWLDHPVLTGGDHGAKACIVGTLLDVTERKNMELALRDSEQRLQGILDNSPAVIYVKDRNGRYLLINRKYEEIFNLRRADVIGCTDAEVHSLEPEAAEAFLRNDNIVIETRQPTEFEEVAPHTDGLHTYISLKFPLMAPNGDVYAICGISTDITDRKRASEAMERAKEEAEAASRAKTVLLANVSHELRTPIMAMMGSAELLLDQQDDMLSRQRTEVILRNARQLRDLINRILDLARLEADRMEMKIDECSLIDLIEDVRAASMPHPAQPNVKYEVVFDSDVPDTIRTDATRLRQALINLVSNALKFTVEGSVRVGVRVVDKGASLRFVARVADTGPGIAPKDAERIFAPFAQLTPEVGGISQGVGLGLPLARAFARHLGGDVTVESTPGKGSCFTLTVHAGPGGQSNWISADDANQYTLMQDLTSKPAPAVSLQGTVLLAEDYPDTRELVEAALTQAGAQVTAVADGVEAVREATQGNFDLILLDLRMPRMDGLEAARAIRAAGVGTAMIALTASAGPEERQRMLEAGFDDLWIKPMHLTGLLEEVSAYLESGGSEAAERSAADCGQPTESSGRFADRIAAANAEYARALPQKVASVREFLANGNKAQARELLHQLAGSGGMHGFMGISTEAGRLLGEIKHAQGPAQIDLSPLTKEAQHIANNHGKK